MDEHLPLGSLDAATLAGLLEKERVQRRALEQEVRRLQAGLARQNAIILRLERRDAERQEELATHRLLVTGLTEQNALLRQQVARLERENAQLRGTPLGRASDGAPEQKAASETRERTLRKRRAAAHNHGRRRMARATRWETHAAATCPQCGESLTGGWFARRVQVIEVPPVAPLEITEHRIIRRRCRHCGTQVLPPPVGEEAGRIGRSRFGPRLIAAIATMRTMERLPLQMIRDRLQREYGLTISEGGIVGLLARMARAGHPVYEQLQADVRASPVVHADETGWRENGQHTTIWTVSTAQSVLVSHGRRTNEHIDGLLGADYAGTLVTDCYAAYDHFLGPKQRCWAHLVRELETLLHEQAAHEETVAWVEGILSVYEHARAERPAVEEGWTPQAARAREHRAQQCEALIILLCPATLNRELPYATLAMRFRKYLPDLFTFVRDPLVPSTNNAAERSLRPLVIARKISGGTRSPTGSTTRMILYSLCATARMQGQDPATVCQTILLAPPGSPSPLADSDLRHSHPL
jgi:hypothetical protein